MAARKPKTPEPVTAAGARRDLVRLLRMVSDAGHQLWQVWSDFVEATAIAISNQVDLHHRDAREARYLQIVARYKPEQVARFPEAFGALSLAFAEEPTDVLGSVFMELAPLCVRCHANRTNPRTGGDGWFDRLTQDERLAWREAQAARTQTWHYGRPLTVADHATVRAAVEAGVPTRGLFAANPITAGATGMECP